MFVLGILVGILSYIVFLIGIMGWLKYLPFVFCFYVIFLLIYARKFLYLEVPKIPRDNLTRLFLSLLFVLAVVNITGALGPETAFDATWYHLTIPKIFIENGRIFFIDRGLFYYSLFPKLTEMLYLAGIGLFNEIAAKLIHFSFGILTAIVIYKLGRNYLDRRIAVLASLVFYSNLVVDWLSIASYVDLTRAFFEITALYSFFFYFEKKRSFNLILSATLLGLAISVKLLSFILVPVYISLILFNKNLSFTEKINHTVLFFTVCIFTVMPWLVFSFLNSGNPIYPIFSGYNVSDYGGGLINPLVLLGKLQQFFVVPPDPVSPIYLMLLPLLFFLRKKIFLKYRLLFLYLFLSIPAIFFTPISGYSRFIIGFLAFYSILVGVAIKEIKHKSMRKMIFSVIVFISIISIVYRAAANAKYIPFLLGNQSKDRFLMANLNFDYGDFYDQNGEIENIVKKKKVLLLGLHNLFYVNFNYTLEEWNEDDYDYILLQGSEIPEEYISKKPIYINDLTRVKLYKR